MDKDFQTPAHASQTGQKSKLDPMLLSSAELAPVDEENIRKLAGDDIIHLGSHAHERWAVQREVMAVTDREMSVAEASQVGLFNKKIMCWHYGFWKNIPDEKKRGNRVICFFHHHFIDRFDDPQIIAGVCMNSAVYHALKRKQPRKAVWLVSVGGAEDAVPYAHRAHKTEKTRLFMAGNARAPTIIKGSDGHENQPGHRKGAELIIPIAERLDPGDYAWVFVGPGWEPHAQALTSRGWTAIYPGKFLPAPRHFEFFGEGDVFLMLSKLEGGPLTLLETMGLGMWPICTHTGLAPDIIQQGVNGYLVQAYDGPNADQVAGQFAGHIRTLDKSMLKTSQKAVRDSVARFTWNNFQKEIDGIIQTCFQDG